MINNGENEVPLNYETWFRRPEIPNPVVEPVVEPIPDPMLVPHQQDDEFVHDDGSVHTDQEAMSVVSFEELDFEEDTQVFFYVLPENLQGLFLLDPGFIGTIVDDLRQRREDGFFDVRGDVLRALVAEYPDFFQKLGFLNSVSETKIWYNDGDFETEGFIENIFFFPQPPTFSEYPLHESYFSGLDISDFHDKVSSVLDAVPNEKWIGSLHTFLYSTYRDDSFDIDLDDVNIKFFIIVEAYNQIIRFVDDVCNCTDVFSEEEVKHHLGIPDSYESNVIHKLSVVDTRRLFDALEFAIENTNSRDAWTKLSHLVTSFLIQFDESDLQSINTILALQDRLTTEELEWLTLLIQSFLRLQLVCDLMLRILI